MTSAAGLDSRAFHDFELAGWQKIPAEYDHAFASLTSQAAQALLDATQVRRDSSVLDVATGPGYVAAAAAKRGARVVAVDFSAGMVEAARRRFPGVEFRTGDAEALSFGQGSFDAVVMNFGLLHLGRPEQALHEAQRVLRRSARFAFTVWAPPEQAVGFGIVLRAIEAHGTLDVPLPPGPPFFRFSDPAESTRALRRAGFAEPQIVQVPQTWRLPAADALFRFMDEGTVRTAGLLRAQTPAARAAIRAAVTEETRRYQTGEAIELPMPAVLVSAAKA